MEEEVKVRSKVQHDVSVEFGVLSVGIRQVKIMNRYKLYRLLLCLSSDCLHGEDEPFKPISTCCRGIV